MTMLDELPQPVAKHILDRLVRTGQPPHQFTRTLTVGFEELLQTIEEELLTGLLPKGFGAVRIIVGKNGNGKTHLCRDILARAREHGYAVADIDLSSDRELSTPAALYSMIAGQVESRRDGEIERGIDQIVQELGDARDLQEERGISGTYRETVARLAGPIGLDGDRQVLAQWLRGEPLATGDRRRFKLKARLSDRNAMAWLRNLTLTCTATGATGLVVVLDEAEATLSSSRSNLQTRLVVLLEILNGVTSGTLPHTLFLFTGVAGSFNDQLAALKPVRQRMWPDLPYQDDNANPRTVRITADGTGGIPESDWLHSVSKRIGELSKRAGIVVNQSKTAEIDAVIQKTLSSSMALNKRQFVRKVAEIAARR